MLRFLESFDHYSTVTQKWDGTSDQLWTIGAVGRFGTNGGNGVSSLRGAYKNFGGTENTWIVGFGYLQGAYSNGNPVLICSLYEIGVGHHVGLWLDSSGRLLVRRGSGGGATTLATYSIPLLQNVYHHLAFKATIHDSAGAYEVRLNGATILSGSGVDTRNGGSGYADRIHFSGGINSGDGATMNYTIDDIYICDTVDSGIAGAPNDDFLGDIRVECLLPNANGNSSDFVGSDADSTDNYLLVDDTTPDSDTTYVESPTVGDEDTYGLPNLSSALGTVFGVQLSPFAKKTDAGTRSIASVTRLGTSEEDSADKPLTSSYVYLPDQRDGDPDGNQWTISNVNAMEAGQKVTA